ncbi:MAG TPA: stage III sporulation protein AB [Limnochordales bacterium]
MSRVLRLVGAFVVVASLGAVGFLRAAELHGRVQELREWCRALEMLRAWVAHLRLPAAEAFQAVARTSGGVVAGSLARAGQLLQRGGGLSAGDAWRLAFRSLRDRSFLAAEDVAVLEGFWRQFGRLDQATQLKSFDGACESLRRCLERALEQEQQLSRLARFSGVAAGMGVVLLLL